MKLGDLIQTYTSSFPDETAIVCVDGKVSWSDLLQATERFATALKNCGIDRPILQVNQGFHDIALLLATSLLEGEFIVVPGYYPTDRVTALAHKFDAGGVLKLTQGDLDVALKFPTSGSRQKGSFIGLLTSGTTGDPKCVMHTWQSLTASVKVKPKFKDATWMLGYPITHFAGVQVLVQSLASAGCLVLPRDIFPASGREALASTPVAYICCTPTYIRQMFTAAIPSSARDSVKKVVLGGEIVDQNVIDLIKQQMPLAKVNHVYASTELGARIEIRDEKEGLPLELIDDTTIRIKDGELQLKRSVGSMLGYLHQGPQNVATSSEWVSTKDLVEITNERVRFIGRSDDIINVGGFKVSPQYVEALIRQISEIEDVAVMAQSNAIVGSLVKAKIVLERGVDKEAFRREIVRKCSACMPYYMVPRIFEFVDSLEVTDTYKLKRKAS